MSDFHMATATMMMDEGLKNYKAAQNRIIKSGREIESNLLELYNSLKGTGLNLKLEEEGGDYLTEVTEADDKLRIRASYWWTDERRKEWSPRWGEIYTIEIDPEIVAKKCGNFLRKKTVSEKTGRTSIKIKSGTRSYTYKCDGFKIAKSVGYDSFKGISPEKFFQGCADNYSPHKEKVDRIIDSMTELPGKLVEHLSYLEEESKKFSADKTDKMRSDVGQIAKLVSSTWLEENDDERFKELFSSMPDERKKEVLYRLLDSFETGDHEKIEEWLSEEYPELSKKVSRRVMDDGG